MLLDDENILIENCEELSHNPFINLKNSMINNKKSTNSNNLKYRSKDYIFNAWNIAHIIEKWFDEQHYKFHCGCVFVSDGFLIRNIDSLNLNTNFNILRIKLTRHNSLIITIYSDYFYDFEQIIGTRLLDNYFEEFNINNNIQYIL